MPKIDLSIRSKIAISLVVPLLALASLWGLALIGSVASALDLRTANATHDQLGHPGFRLVIALQSERSRAQEFLATDRRDPTRLRAARTATDQAVGEFRRLSAGYRPRGAAGEVTRARTADLADSLDDFGRLRAMVDGGTLTRSNALSGYSGLISAAHGVLSAASTYDDPDVAREIRSYVAISHAAELLSQEDALVTGATTAGRFGSGEYTQFVGIIGALRFQIPTASAELPERIKTRYLTMFGNRDFSALRGLEDRIVRSGRPGGATPVTADAWWATFSPVSRQLNDFLSAGFVSAMDHARSAGTAILTRAYVAGGAGLLVIIAAVLLSVRTGRSVVRRLSALRAAATDLAGTRLPEVVARLRAGEQVDVDAETLPLPPGTDEIAEVGAALRQVQHSAVESAVGEATLRRGMSRVFVNISHRHQSLIDRQLAVLGQLRAGYGDFAASDPDALRKVVLAEQLATRMRRHAEDLVILAGSAPSRGWLNRVPLAEIIDSATAEVENGERIQIESMVDVSLPGRMVADVIHLFAELLENATSFSPPDTPVQVCAELTPDGVGVQIEDRGLGMATDALEEANRNLAQPPNFDPANSTKLGLFVAAQLAAARGLLVSLRPSPYGGITAEVLIPSDLVERATTPDQPALRPLVGVSRALRR